MWQIESVSAENLGTFKQLSFDVKQRKTYLVTGKNQDDLGQDSNGSGKSWLMEAFAIGIIGESLKKVVLNDLIRNNTNTCLITVVLKNSFLKRTLVINREINRKKASSLKIEIDGVDQSDKLSSIPEGDKFILNQLGISREDLLSYYFISKRRYQSFFSSSDTIKKDIISRFSGSNIIDGIEKEVEKVIDSMVLKKRGLEDNIINISSKIEVYEEDIEREKNRDLGEEKNQVIEALFLQIEKALNQIILFEAEIEGLEGTFENQLATIKKEKFLLDKMELPDVKNDIDKLVVKLEMINETLFSKIKKIEEDLSAFTDKKNREIAAIEKDISSKKEEKFDYNNLLVETLSKINGSVSCPNCKYEFSLQDKNFSIEDARILVPEMEKAIVVYQEAIDLLEKEISRLKEVVQLKKTEGLLLIRQERELAESDKVKISEQITKFEKDLELRKDEINAKSDKIRALENVYKRDLEFIKSKKDLIVIKNKLIESIEKDIQVEKTKNIESRVKELSQKKEEALRNLDDIISKVEVIEKEIFEETQWIYNFKKFKTYLANKAIGTIEGLTNMNLENSKSNLQIKMEGFKVLGNKEIREKISTTVLRDGEEEGLLDKFSEGEKARIEIANIVALQQLINMSSPSGGLDFLGIDEILGSLDTMGVELVANMLNNIQKTILLITHVGIDTISYQNLVKIEKRNKTSYFLF